MEAKGNVAHDEEIKFTGSMELNKCHLQEHEPLHHLLSILPQKAQKGLSSLPIEYTCIDVSPEYIALGTSVGLVLLYDRLGQSLQRLNCKIKTEIITCVKLAESVDYVVAAGTQSGKVFVFQLPSLLPGRAKRMQLYCVSDVHFCQITCVEWSQNTLKLFSGDQDGCVACSEMDYAEQQSKSYIVAEEPHEIVQLDYSFKRLLVSTMFRSFLCAPGVSEKTRLGKKDRKVLGPFAACFKPELCRSEDATIFATRPGLRLWKADMEGNVQTTYMFKDLLSGNTPVIVLLPDTTHGHSTATIEEMTFGRLRTYSESMLVTWHEATLFVLNPDRGTFIGWHSNLENIKGLSVCQNEIFILRDSPGRRKVIRIAQKRDLLNEPVPMKHIGLPTSTIGGQNQSSQSPVHILQQTATNLADAILGVGEKMKGVKEGHTPPWGMAADPNAPPSPDLDSCKEVNSQSSGSSSVTSPEMEHSSHQPTILLDSPDTLTVILQEKDKTSTSPVDKPTFSTNSEKPARSSGSTDTMNKLSSSDGFSSKDIKSHRSTYLSTISVEDDDIVFSPKLKKGRKKRIKSDKDKDTESICSVDSSSVGIEGTPDFTLECPEKYSVQQSEDTGVHQSRTFASTPDCGSSANRRSVGNEPDFKASVDSTFEQSSSTRSENLEGSNSHQPYDPDLQSNTPSITSQKRVVISKPGESNSVTQIQQQSTSPDLPIDNCQMQKDKELVAQPNPSVSDSPYSDLIERLISDNENKPPEVENSSERDPKDSDFLSEMIGDTTDGFSGATEIIQDASDEHSKSQDTDLGTELNQSVSSNSNFSSKSKEPQQIYATSDSSTDDFYSKFKRGNSIVSPGWSPEEEPSIEEAIEKGEPTEILEAATRKDLRNRLADTWTEFLAPGNLVSICLTSRHIWCVDKSDRLHYSGLSGPGLKWRKVDEPAKQISVSRSGWIVWRLYNGSAYAGTAITPRAPAGMKWVEAARDVAFMAVDNTIAWYIKSNGEISVQKSISRERPSYRAKKVSCQAKLLQVVCQDDVVWVVTEARSILVRMGIKAGTEEGTDWTPLNKEGADLVVSNVAFGDNGTAWVVDVVGRVWFTTGVRWDNPSGTGKWWQVSLSEYLMEDYKAVDTLKSLATFPQNLSKIIAKEKGGLMAVGSNGIWICPGCKHVLHVCRGGITGHRFNAVVPSGMATSAKWLNISAGAVDDDNGLIWAQQPNNAIFCFPSHNKKFSEVSHPEFSSPFVCISSTKEAVWGLLGDGRVVIRGGMAAHCPQGLNWTSLDLIQLGSAKLVHLSCSTEGVWGVDNNGMVYLRIGIKPPGRGDHGYLNPAWVPVDGTTQGAGAKFNKVFAGPIDWMVWAIDTKKQVYARKGISDSMPIGTRWSYIPGTTAEKLCLSERYVYVLNTHGEVLVRFGVSPDNPGGDYWKKVPGAFKEITATTQDELWGINHDGQLCQRAVYYLQRQDVLEELSDGPVGKDSIGDDWELI